MKAYLPLAVFIMIVWPGVASAKSLCAATERTYFSCLTPANKIVSLCASNDFAKDQGTIQYRFGKPAHMELEYPATRKKAEGSIYYGHYSRAQADYSRVYFTIGKTMYEIFSRYHGDLPVNGQTQTSGVTVTTANGKEIQIQCAADITDDLAKLDGILSCDPDMVDCEQ